MRRVATVTAGAVLVLVLLSAALSGGQSATVTAPGGRITVAVADTPQERRDGLMNRSSVPRDGLLFVFPSERERTFWMKDTYIPLDIVFIAGNGTVRRVAAADPEPGVPPEESTRYHSGGPVRYVLELPQGEAGRLGIAAGTTVTVRQR